MSHRARVTSFALLACFAATLAFASPAHATTIDQIVFSPSPIASPATLAASVTKNVTVTAKHGGAGISGATLYVFFQRTSGGGSAFVGSTQLSTVPKPFVANSSGAVTVTYHTPSVLPGGGRDIITAQNASSSPTVKVQDSYVFTQIAHINPDPGAFAPPGSLAGNQVVSQTFTALDASSNPVAGAPLLLSMKRASGGGSMTVGTTSLSSSWTRLLTDGSGNITVSYRAPSSLPSTGTDELSVQDATVNITVTDHMRYTFGVPQSYHFSLTPIAASNSLAPGAVVSVAMIVGDATGHVVPDAPVYVSFNKTAGGGSLKVGVNSISSTPHLSAADYSGTITFVYTAPSPLPDTGTDTIVAQNALSSPTVTASDTYSFLPTSGDRFHPLPAARIYGTNAPLLVAGADRDINVLNVGGVPGTNVDAVAINVEVQNTTQAGYIRVTPTGSPSRTAVQEFRAGGTISNLVVSKVGNGGKVNLHLSAGSAKVFVDVEGYYTNASVTSGDLFHSVPTARIYGTNAPLLVSGADRDINVLNTGGVPGANVDAVVINVEVQKTTRAGYIRVTPTGSPSQTAVQEFGTGATISNLVMVKVGTGGKVNLHLSAGSAQVFVDVEGFYTDSSITYGDRFHALPTARIYGTSAPLLVSGADRNINVLNLGGVPSTNVDAVVINVEIQNATKAGYIRVTPAGTSSQTAVQEFPAGGTISNLVVVKVGTNGMVNLHLSAGSAQVFVDVEGYY